jgi:hypothetical protein
MDRSTSVAAPAGASSMETNTHLARSTREVVEGRIHATAGEASIKRFRRDEAAALWPLHGRPPFR